MKVLPNTLIRPGNVYLLADSLDSLMLRPGETLEEYWRRIRDAVDGGRIRVLINIGPEAEAPGPK